MRRNGGPGRRAAMVARLRLGRFNHATKETRWKGSKSRELGDGYKLIYQGTSNHGVGIILNESFRNSVTVVDRLSDRLMAVKLRREGVLLGRSGAVRPIPGRRRHTSRKDGFESCHGGYGFGARNDDGSRILEYVVTSDLIIANTQYRKRESHLITYTSGGRETQIDFWMLRRRDRRLLQDSKVIPTDHVAAQHHLLVMDLKISRPRKRHPRTETQRIKWWNLKDRKEVFSRPWLHLHFLTLLVVWRKCGRLLPALYARPRRTLWERRL
ncbi:hypothetical protein RB195_023265 [Necator americanus]|uniref:Endonuclease/exonuclease/phosphatase domain-containing protein n=1 Tax=Necator americanus TaxID=51031 RepID=A0ABR1EIN4_NECAM